MTMTPEQLRDFCLEQVGSDESFPFSPEVSVFKVGGKMFALSKLADEPLEVSVKCDPELSEMLRGVHASIIPGYHLPKRHWITVTLGGDVDDDHVRELIEASYDLVAPRRA
ncbi:MAG: MmcQ-like protein [Thermoleophilia bacterium]|nr:MmcQ-like protein [Thermoleophilia bacterium]